MLQLDLCMSLQDGKIAKSLVRFCKSKVHDVKWHFNVSLFIESWLPCKSHLAAPASCMCAEHNHLLESNSFIAFYALEKTALCITESDNTNGLPRKQGFKTKHSHNR